MNTNTNITVEEIAAMEAKLAAAKAAMDEQAKKAKADKHEKSVKRHEPLFKGLLVGLAITLVMTVSQLIMLPLLIKVMKWASKHWLAWIGINCAAAVAGGTAGYAAFGGFRKVAEGENPL